MADKTCAAFQVAAVPVPPPNPNGVPIASAPATPAPAPSEYYLNFRKRTDANTIRIMKEAHSRGRGYTKIQQIRLDQAHNTEIHGEITHTGYYTHWVLPKKLIHNQYQPQYSVSGVLNQPNYYLQHQQTIFSTNKLVFQRGRGNIKDMISCGCAVHIVLQY